LVDELANLEAYLDSLPALRRPRFFGPGFELVAAPRSILLGNGWSRALSDRYGYGDLLDLMRKRGLPPNLVAVCQHFDGHVETAMQALRDHADGQALPDGMVRILPPRPHAGLAADQLRNALIEAVCAVNREGNNAHATQHEKTELERKFWHAWRFLRRFRRVFTLNYDLLLYYVYMQALRAKRADGWRDGFSRRHNGRLVGFSGLHPNAPEIYYVHGGLHLVAVASGTTLATCKRIRYMGSEDDPIMFPESVLDQAMDDIRRGTYPLFVAEGHANHKRAKIESNSYLEACYSRLASFEGHLVVYGFSFGPSDNHVRKALASNPNLLSVAASYFSPAGRPRLVEQLELLNTERAKNGLEPITLSIFPAQSVDVWGWRCGRCGMPIVPGKVGPQPEDWPPTCESCAYDLMGLQV
jgi:hypothetical protein